MKQTEKDFIATGTFLVKDGIVPILDHYGELVGFKTPQGIVRLCICLELEKEDGTFKYLNTGKQMQDVGISLFEYGELKFRNKP